MKYLIFGNGYLGNKFLNKLGPQNATMSLVDIANIDEVKRDVETYNPTIIINAAGATGVPNIDWCEDHKAETVYSNVTGPLVLAEIALKNNIQMVHLGSGCVYYGSSRQEHEETESPNISDVLSFYSKTKAWAEQILSNFPVLQIRLRMPVDSTPNPRNLIWKISHYAKVMDKVPNSISIIPDMVDAAIKLSEKGCTGIYNVVNPGHITHGEILKLYKEFVDPKHTYEPISEEDLAKMTKTARSNCLLSTKKLENEGIKLPEIHERIKEILVEYGKETNADSGSISR